MPVLPRDDLHWIPGTRSRQRRFVRRPRHIYDRVFNRLLIFGFQQTHRDLHRLAASEYRRVPFNGHHAHCVRIVRCVVRKKKPVRPPGEIVADVEVAIFRRLFHTGPELLRFQGSAEAHLRTQRHSAHSATQARVRTHFAAKPPVRNDNPDTLHPDSRGIRRSGPVEVDLTFFRNMKRLPARVEQVALADRVRGKPDL